MNITPSQIKNKVKSVLGRKSSVYLESNLWKLHDKKEICLSIKNFGTALSRSEYVGTIHMDYNLQIIRVEECDYPQIAALLVGLTLVDKSKEGHNVYDRYRGVGYACVEGIIKGGKFMPLTKTNILDTLPAATYTTNNKKGWDTRKNMEFVSIFKDIVNNNKKSIESVHAEEDGLDDRIVHFKFPKATVTLKLRALFDFSLEMTLRSNDEKKRLELSEKKIHPEMFEQIMSEFLSGKPSVLVKALMTMQSYRDSLNEYSFDIQEEDHTAIVAVKYYPGLNPVRGVYTYSLNFKKKTVVCLDNKKSTTFIPEQVARFQENIKAL